jgi:putative hydrolase of the HAD superfamily
VPAIEAVFFDVEFTLIFPGPRFQGSGYQATCARHGLRVEADRFEAAVAGAAAVLDEAHRYDADLYLRYTRRIIELMGGSSPGLQAAAQEIYDAWAEHHHFSLYEDVRAALLRLHGAGLGLGLISNSQRCLVSFQEHFELQGLIRVVVSSPEHGYMKPHPAIFRAALDRMGVAAGSALMVGDSLAHDVNGARAAGMRAVLLARGAVPPGVPDDVPVIRSLSELAAVSLAAT